MRYSMARRNQIFGISSFLSRFIRKVPDDGPSYYALALPHPRSRSPSRIPVPSARKRAVASYTDRRFPDPFTDRSEMSRGRSTSFTLAFTPSSEAYFRPIEAMDPTFFTLHSRMRPKLKPSFLFQGARRTIPVNTSFCRDHGMIAAAELRWISSASALGGTITGVGGAQRGIKRLPRLRSIMIVHLRLSPDTLLASG